MNFVKGGKDIKGLGENEIDDRYKGLGVEVFVGILMGQGGQYLLGKKF